MREKVERARRGQKMAKFVRDAAGSSLGHRKLVKRCPAECMSRLFDKMRSKSNLKSISAWWGLNPAARPDSCELGWQINVGRRTVF